MARPFKVGERVLTIVDALQTGVPIFSPGVVVEAHRRTIRVRVDHIGGGDRPTIAVQPWQIRRQK